MDIKKIILASLVVVSITGCNAGMSPAGGSNEEIKAAYDALPIEERVKIINSSGMPAEDKKAKIAELYKKEGKEPPADVLSGGGQGGPPPSGK
jgi:hypothetical protein